MVARGDLGVEIPLYEVPVWQRRIIDTCAKCAYQRVLLWLFVSLTSGGADAVPCIGMGLRSFAQTAGCRTHTLTHVGSMCYSGDPNAGIDD